MTLPMRLLFGIIASQDSGTPPPVYSHIQTFQYTGDGVSGRQISFPGIDMSPYGYGVMFIRRLDTASQTIMFLAKSALEGYFISSTELHEACGHCVSALGDGFCTLTDSPLTNGAGGAYSLIVMRGSDDSYQRYFDGTLVETDDLTTVYHDLGKVPDFILAKPDEHADVPTYQSIATPTPHDGNMYSNVAGPVVITDVWNNTAPTSTSFDIKGFVNGRIGYGVWGNTSGSAMLTSYMGESGAQIVDVGFAPKFVMIKNILTSDNWFWFSEEMEKTHWFHYGTIAAGHQWDLVDFLPNGVYVKDPIVLTTGKHLLLAVG